MIGLLTTIIVLLIVSNIAAWYLLCAFGQDIKILFNRAKETENCFENVFDKQQEIDSRFDATFCRLDAVRFRQYSASEKIVELQRSFKDLLQAHTALRHNFDDLRVPEQKLAELFANFPSFPSAKEVIVAMSRTMSEMNSVIKEHGRAIDQIRAGQAPRTPRTITDFVGLRHRMEQEGR